MNADTTSSARVIQIDYETNRAVVRFEGEPPEVTDRVLFAPAAHEALPRLPSAFEFVYEFASPFGGTHRKLTQAKWNGNKPSQSYLVYTDQQMREYGALCAAFCPGSPAPAVPSGWQPVEAAPRDGTLIDVWSDGERIADAFWARPGDFTEETWCTSGNEHNSGKRCNERIGAVTHWMPLPQAPEAE